MLYCCDFVSHQNSTWTYLEGLAARSFPAHHGWGSLHSGHRVRLSIVRQGRQVATGCIPTLLHGKEGVCTVFTFDSICKHLARSYTYLLFVTSYGYWILQICKRCGTEFLKSLQPVLSGAVDRRIKTRSAVLKLDTAAEPRCVRLLRRGGVTEEKPAT